MSVTDIGADWDAVNNPPPPPPPPPPTDYIDQISDLDAVFLPTYTLAGSITQGVTNPIGLGGGVYEVNDAAGSGYRFVATSSMAAPWDSSTKTCLAVRDRRPGVGQFEQWDFKYRYPLADNPSFSTGFFAGAIFEFGHTQTNSGLKLDFDGRNVSGALGHYLGVPKAPWGVGDFDYISIVDYTTFLNQRGHDYVLTARIRYNPDSTGYVQVIIDGRTIIDQFRPMRPNTSEIPKIQFGYYSDRTAAKNGSEIRNLNYQYNV
jgi:hypothetical protein